VWQEESFDRILRKEESIDAAVIYMLGNPVRAGLVRSPSDYKWFWNAPPQLIEQGELRARTPVAPQR